LLSCGSHSDIIIDNRIALTDLKYRVIDSEHKKNQAAKNYIVVSSKRYFLHSKNSGPEEAIMSAGIKEALKKNYLEAETLFNEIKENINDGSIENNLAIIFELTKRENEALGMYITALMKSPEKAEIKNNLLSYINDKKFIDKKI
jgi:Flp pilus assembly protein TadD